MLRLLFAVAGFCLFQGATCWITCEDANVAVDKSLAYVNNQVKVNGENNVLVDRDGFQSTVSPRVFGWKLPLSVELSVSQGNLTGMDSLTRAADTKDCKTYTMGALEGIFEYGPGFSLTYEVATARFLSWEIHGTFSFKPKPRLHVYLLNETDALVPSCRMESIRLEDLGQSDYTFDYGNSWMGWLVSKMLAQGLKYEDDTPMMTHVGLWSQAQVGSYLVDAWCQLAKTLA